MRRIEHLALTLALFLSCAAVAQNVRYSTPFFSVSSTSPPFVVANVPPNSPKPSLCNWPANGVPCTNYATTYTQAGVTCPNGAQDTPDPQPSACQSTADAQGNIGFWTVPGRYDYTVCVGTTCYGPYTITVGAGSTNGCSGGTCLLTPPGAGIVSANGIDGNTTNANNADVNGAAGFTVANDANVVHKTGVETVAGAKTFSNDLTLSGNLNIYGTLNFSQTGPFFVQGKKQTGTPTVGASYDFGQYVDSASIFRCQLLSGSSCGLGISPIYLNAGTPASQTNECASVTNDSSGSTTVTAVAVFRTVLSGVGHDVLCVITVDAANPSIVGSLVFPVAVGLSTNSAPSQAVPGVIESLRSVGGQVVVTNNGGTNRTNSINMRACNGPGATNCGTDLQIIEDSTGTGKAEWEFIPGGAASPLYIGGLGSPHPGAYLGGNIARLNSPFGFDGPSVGNLSHLLRLAADGDIWNPATLVGGSVTVNFQRNNTSTTKPLCFATWQGTGTLTGILKCSANGSAGAWTGITITSTGVPAIIGVGSVAMPTGALTTNTCATANTIPLTGVAGGDTIQWSYNAAPGSPDGLLTITPYTTTNNVNFLQCNPTSATQTPVAATLSWTVLRSSTASSDTAVVSYLVVGDAF